jgi:ribosomal protein S18 acetylase RimI-like enzyme
MKCIEKARQCGAEKIILQSNTILEPAINLYRKLGFEEVDTFPSEYKRSNIHMEPNIL